MTLAISSRVGIIIFGIKQGSQKLKNLHSVSSKLEVKMIAWYRNRVTLLQSQYLKFISSYIHFSYSKFKIRRTPWIKHTPSFNTQFHPSLLIMACYQKSKTVYKSNSSMVKILQKCAAACGLFKKHKFQLNSHFVISIFCTFLQLNRHGKHW